MLSVRCALVTLLGHVIHVSRYVLTCDNVDVILEFLLGAANEGNGHSAGVGIGWLPHNHKGLSGIKSRVLGRLADGVEAVGLGENYARKGEDGGGGETHFGGFWVDCSEYKTFGWVSRGDLCNSTRRLSGIM